MQITCKCGNTSESKVVGRDFLFMSNENNESVKVYHPVHNISKFNFHFLEYNQTLYITCKECNEEVNICDTYEKSDDSSS